MFPERSENRVKHGIVERFAQVDTLDLSAECSSNGPDADMI